MLKKKYMQLANPVESIKIPMTGIASAYLTENLRNVWTVDFEVDKYIDGELNPCYDSISPLMEIYIQDYGYFILSSAPEEYDDGNRIYKGFTAYGIEKQHEQERIIDLYINTGTELSREYYEENITELGEIKNNGKFYITNPSQDKTSANYWELGLLNILYEEHLKKKGWTIGHVDATLAAKRGRTFSWESTNVYAVLTQDIPKSFKCLPIFDRINKTVNFYEISNVGSEYNIEFSFRNFVNDVARVNQTDDFYTQLKVSGANDNTSIAPYNYGSEYVEDFDYLAEIGVFDSEIASKYAHYKEEKDAHREEYMNAWNLVATYQGKIDRIENLAPIDEVTTAWNAFTVAELQQEKANFQAIADYIVRQHGGTNIDPSDKDYPTQKSITLVIIPDIDKEIDRQNAGSVENFSHINYKIIWELYGKYELEAFLQNYQNAIRTYTAKGYDHAWQDGVDTDDKGSHNRNYATYQTYQQYVQQIQSRLNTLNTLISQNTTSRDQAQATRDSLASYGDITNQRYGFTDVELLYINYLRVDCDFNDSSIEVIDPTDYSEVCDCAKDLYESAVREAAIISRPQRRYEFSTDNPFLNTTAAQQLQGLTVGDFLQFELDNREKIKQRVVSLGFNILDMNDINYEISLSDMTTLWGDADDYRFLLESGSGGVSGVTISSAANARYIQGIASSAASDVLAKYLNGTGTGGGASALIAGMSQDDILVLADKLAGLVDGVLDLTSLSASFATIGQLEAEHIFAGTIESDLGTFKTLTTDHFTANDASIGALNTDVANIGSLLAGNAGVGTLQTINLTADNTTIANALIKDAMIDNISATKITSGSINTNNVTITSTDGGILISGNTQQWTDGNGTVRMQAGQDAQGDFNFAVFGTDGQTLYFDETGIHADAVPNQLIVNRMVSDNANIDAAKIDIETLFDVINDDQTHTLNASKVWLDTEQQNLGAAFTSLTSTVGTNTGNISTLSSNYSVMNGKLEANIQATSDIDDQLNNQETGIVVELGNISTNLSNVTSTVSEQGDDISTLQTNTSQLSQDFTSFQTTVSSTYQTKSDADSDYTALQTYAQSQVSQFANSITLSVTNNADNSVVSITGDGITAQSQTIKFTGDVIFASDLTDGTTQISGDNIQTGIIQDATGRNYWNLTTGELRMQALSDIEIGARNWIRRSNTLDFEDYYFRFDFEVNGESLTLNSEVAEVHV